MIRISVPPRNRGWTTTGWIGLAFLLAGHATALGPLVTRGLLSDWGRAAIRWTEKEKNLKGVKNVRVIDRAYRYPRATVPQEPFIGATDREWVPSGLLAVGDPREYSSSVFVVHSTFRYIYIYIFRTRFAVNRRVAREPAKMRLGRWMPRETARSAGRSSTRKFRYVNIRNRTEWCFSGGWTDDIFCAEETWMKFRFPLTPGPVGAERAEWRNAAAPFPSTNLRAGRNFMCTYDGSGPHLRETTRYRDRDIDYQ